MTTILILIGIYLVSVIGAYKIIQKLAKYPGVEHFVFTIYPILNTIVCIIGLTYILDDKIDWNKFFNKF